MIQTLGFLFLLPDLNILVIHLILTVQFGQSSGLPVIGSLGCNLFPINCIKLTFHSVKMFSFIYLFNASKFLLAAATAGMSSSNNLVNGD